MVSASAASVSAYTDDCTGKRKATKADQIFKLCIFTLYVRLITQVLAYAKICICRFHEYISYIQYRYGS